MNQTYKDFEIILVDDGSKDKSLEICRDFENKDVRVKVLYKENTGVSSARNLGMNFSKGEFLLFVDADDYLSSVAIDSYLNCQKKNDADIVFAKYAKVSKSKESIVSVNDLPQHDDNLKTEIITRLLQIKVQDGMMGSAGRCLFRKNMLKKNNINFDISLKMSEDLKFVLQAVLVADKITTLDNVLCFFVENSASVTNNYMESGYRDLLRLLEWKKVTFSKSDDKLYDVIEIAKAHYMIWQIRNLNMRYTPYRLSERVIISNKLVKENKHNIEFALTKRHYLPKNSAIGCILCRLRLLWLLNFIYAVKSDTLYVKRRNYKND